MGLVSSRTTRWLTAGALAATAAVFAANDFLTPEPDLDGKGVKALASASAGLAQLQSGTFLDVAYAILVTLSFIALTRVVTGRGTGLVVGGAVLGLVTNLVHAAVVVIQVVVMTLVASGDPNAAGIWDRLNNDPHLLPFFPMIMLYPFSYLVVAAGLARARVISWWLLALPGAAIVLDIAQPFPGSHHVLTVAFAIFTAVQAAAILSGARTAEPAPAAVPAAA